MKQSIGLISMLSLAAAAVAMAREAPAADVLQIDLAEWTPPSIGSVGDDSFGKLVKYGYALFTDTPNQIGPAAPDPAKFDARRSQGRSGVPMSFGSILKSCCACFSRSVSSTAAAGEAAANAATTLATIQRNHDMRSSSVCKVRIQIASHV